MSSKIVFWSAVVLAFVLALGIRLYYLPKKAAFYVDEPWGMEAANFKNWGIYQQYPEGREFTGAELKKMTFWDDGSVRDLVEDLRNLRRANIDTTHTNLYYSLLRVAFFRVDDANLVRWRNRGLALNLLIFCASFALLAWLLRRLYGETLLVPLTLLAAFLSTGALSDFLFIRPYPLQETMLIAATILFVVQDEALSAGKTLTGNWQLFSCGLVWGLVLLSGYFSLLYAGLLGLYLVVHAGRLHQKENAAFLCWEAFAGLLFACVIYAEYPDGFVSFRAVQGYHKFSVMKLMGNSWESLGMLGCHLMGYLAYPLVLLALAVGGLGWQKKAAGQCARRGRLAALAVVMLVWMYGCLWLANFKAMRYIMPVFPVVCVLLPAYLEHLRPRVRVWCAVALAALFAVAAVRPAWLGTEIQNLETAKGAQYFFRQAPALPVVVLNRTPWKIFDFVPYLADRQRYCFTYTPEAFAAALARYGQCYAVWTEAPAALPDGSRASRAAYEGTFTIRKLEPRR